MLAIGCGYPDGDDFDWLRRDPAFKLACGRLPDSGVYRLWDSQANDVSARAPCSHWAS